MRCGSARIMRFLDGFGQRRMFCKSCAGSILENRFFTDPNDQTNLKNFNFDIYSNPRAVVRH